MIWLVSCVCVLRRMKEKIKTRQIPMPYNDVWILKPFKSACARQLSHVCHRLININASCSLLQCSHSLWPVERITNFCGHRNDFDEVPSANAIGNNTQLHHHSLFRIYNTNRITINSVRCRREYWRVVSCVVWSMHAAQAKLHTRAHCTFVCVSVCCICMHLMTIGWHSRLIAVPH